MHGLIDMKEKGSWLCEYLDGEHSGSFWGINAVPHTEVAPILCHNHIATRYPLHIRAVVEDRVALLCLQVVQMQLQVIMISISSKVLKWTGD